ncbi:MAG: HAD hydrolase-like protein [Candidatus Aenigmatarchaeota archaeon]
MINSVVFDFNGTLFADTTACWEADNHILKTFGGNKISLKEFRNTFSIPAINFYSVNGCDKNGLTKDSEKLGKIFHGFYEKRAAKLRSRKNAKIVLKWLQENGIDSVILSNHTVAGINFQLERLGMKKYIGTLLANTALDSSMKARSKQKRLEDYIKTNSLRKEGIIIIGDTCEEIEIGRIAGIRTVAITGGYYSEARLRKGKPDFMISGLKELIGIIREINS